MVKSRLGNPITLIWLCSVATLPAWLQTGSPPGGQVRTGLSFEDIETGQLPAGWKVEATGRPRRARGAGALAEATAEVVNPLATWEVTEDDSAPDGNHVLALSSPGHKSGGTFNLCWTDGTSFGDGEISVRFKANTGVIDQGGGIIWRAVDKDNHYVCRANPLEDNLWLYHTVDGRRASIQRVDVEMTSGEWHEVKIAHAGNHIRCFYDSVLLIEVDDDTFTEPGGVGLWTKADAATSFDEFRVATAGRDR